MDVRALISFCLYKPEILKETIQSQCSKLAKYSYGYLAYYKIKWLRDFRHDLYLTHVKGKLPLVG